MEGSSEFMPAASRQRDAGVDRATQIGLLVASLGAFLIIFDLFGLATAGLFLAAGGAALAAPGGAGSRWYVGVAGGAILAVLSRLIAESSETLGGWLAVFGAVAIMMGASLGYPVRSSEEE
jgi:hypothetical protein